MSFDLPSGFRDAEIAPNGTIYVLVYDKTMIDGEFQIEAALNYYDTSTGEVNERNLAYLLEPYPVPILNLFIDRQKRIWLDNFAYQDKDGYGINPNVLHSLFPLYEKFMVTIVVTLAAVSRTSFQRQSSGSWKRCASAKSSP